MLLEECVSNMNFRIVEGSDPLEDIAEDFIRLYADETVRVKDICDEFGISKSQYINLLQRLRRRGEITKVRNPHGGRKKTRQYSKLHPKNYVFNRKENVFQVRRNGEYYACFKQEKDAKRYVELMRENDWDKSKRWILKEKVLKE